MALFKLVEKSGNTKIGSMVAITADRTTCPKTCPHIGKCYPNAGNLRIWWDRMDKGEWGYNFDQLIKAILDLPFFSFVRYGQAGDLPSRRKGSGIIDPVQTRKMIQAFKKVKAFGFLYTHKKDPKNIPILREVDQVLAVNISCESIVECKKWIKRGFKTVLTSDKIKPGKNCWRDGDTKVMRCPNQLNKKVQCDRCTLCMDRDPNLIILFRSNKNTSIDT